jgi:hypothetical protein
VRERNEDGIEAKREGAVVGISAAWIFPVFAIRGS